MDTIEVKKNEVLRILQINRKKHIEEYKIAIRGYRIKCAELLEKELSLIENGEEFQTYFNITKPQSHERDYDLAIEMLEMDINDVVKLDSQEFLNYIKDDWNWKKSFSITNSVYSGYSGAAGSSGTYGYSGSAGTRSLKFSSDEL